jgi:hypothetical protein
MKIASALLILLLVGCHDVEKRTYDVTLHNQSSKTVTIWLTKNGPAYEQGWKSPEDLVIESPRMNERIAGVFVPAGKTAFTGKVTGEFAPGVDAILRVYMGQRSLDELLAMSRGSVDRFDVLLKPGANDLVVSDHGEGIQVTQTP